MSAQALIGTVLGTCTLQSLIGQGGMGAVFLAQQSRPKRQVAVKVLLPGSPLTPQQHAAFLERFRRETDAAASLVHPNVMPVHEYGERDGLAYLVMPYIGGGTLRDELERSGPLPLLKVLNSLEQLSAALDTAHQRGVIHRDVKPANILITNEGRLVLSDFGLVKIVAEGGTPQSRLTGVGIPLGTPDYMSPEQVIGGDVDGRADIYSLGVILYQMVTGTTPFKGDLPMQIAVQHLHASPPPPHSLRPDLPATAEQVMLRVLAKQPVERYRSGEELVTAFREALSAGGVNLEDGQMASMATEEGDARSFTRRGLFDPMWQGISLSGVMGNLPVAVGALATAENNNRVGDLAEQGTQEIDIVAKTSVTLPSFSNLLAPPASVSERRASVPVSHTPLPPVNSLGVRNHMLNRAEDARKISAHGVQSSESSAGAMGQVNQPAVDLSPGSSLVGSTPGLSQGLLSQQQVGGQGASVTMEVPLSESRGRGAQGTMKLVPDNNQQPNPEVMKPPVQRMPGTRSLSDYAVNGQSMVGNGPMAGAPGPANSSQMPFPAYPGQNTAGAGNPVGNPMNGQSIPGTMQVPFPSSNGQNMGGMANAADAAMSGASMAGGTQLPFTPYNGQSIAGTMKFSDPNGQSMTSTMQLQPLESQAGTMKLPQPMKVVKVPVAGQPGRYVTGLLPVLPADEEPLLPSYLSKAALMDRAKKNWKAMILMSAVFLILVGSGSLWLVLTLSHQQEASLSNSRNGNSNSTKMAATATFQARATATAYADIIIDDPLKENTHNLPVGSQSDVNFNFTDGAYHITNGSDRAAIPLLPDVVIPQDFVYSVDLYEAKGDDSSDASINNQIGIALRYKHEGDTTRGYFFDMVVSKNDQAKNKLEFWQYDSTRGDNKAWENLWKSDKFPDGFHAGMGANNKNTFKVVVKGDSFTLFVNNKELATVHDNRLKDGQVGMFVNLKGSEGVFKNLKLTHH